MKSQYVPADGFQPTAAEWAKFVLEVKRRQVQESHPWAVKIVTTSGGFWLFESMEDHRMWKAAQREALRT